MFVSTERFVDRMTDRSIKFEFGSRIPSYPLFFIEDLPIILSPCLECPPSLFWGFVSLPLPLLFAKRIAVGEIIYMDSFLFTLATSGK